MLIRITSFFHPRHPTGIFAIAVLILTGGLYVVFDSHLDSVGREIVGSWLQSEAVSIQEGNLLSSIAKNQRVLLSSQFIKGIKLVDTERKTALIEFGEDYDVQTPRNLDVEKFESHTFGFLHRRLYYRLSGQSELVLSFQTHSDFLIRAFFATVAAFIALLTFLFVSVRRVETKRIEAENRNSILLGEVAARVAHDIRSPLATLTAVLETIHGLPPSSQKLLTTAILRIREIGLGIADHSRLAIAESSALKADATSLRASTEPTLIAQLLEELVDEKRIQYRTRTNDISLVMNPNDRSKFADLNANELRRSLSNLIDNSIEASSAGTPIKIAFSVNDDSVRIEVVDHGSGMANESLSRIGEKGFTRNKVNGTGIGVHFAKRAVTGWNGTLEYQSNLGAGTTATIELPLESAPSWFINNLGFSGCSTVVIVDDDPTIHSMWKDRLATTASDLSVEHFFDAESAASWAVHNRASLSRCLLLTDFNLNSRNGTGLTVLERFGLSHPSAVMVTNAFDDVDLRKRCEKLNVKIMPKTMMSTANFDIG